MYGGGVMWGRRGAFLFFFVYSTGMGIDGAPGVIVYSTVISRKNRETGGRSRGFWRLKGSPNFKYSS